MEKHFVICGNSEKLLAGIPDNSVDLICTDPPYGIAFMGKKWDKVLPSLEIWRECLRVLRPGAFAFVMCIPRSDCNWRMKARLEEAGFRIDFSSIYHVFASGFPKAMSIPKAIEKRHREPDSIEDVNGCGGMTSDKGYNVTKHREHYDELTHSDAIRFDGAFAGFQPKPAWEEIIVAMKPLGEKTFVDQALENGKGVIWLGDGRIPYKSKRDRAGWHNSAEKGEGAGRSSSGFLDKIADSPASMKNSEGRFPANLLISSDALDDGQVTKPRRQQVSNKGSIWGGGNEDVCIRGVNDSGSFSRYFSLDAWWAERIKDLPESVRQTFPFLIVPKAAGAEKTRGLRGFPEKRKWLKGGGVGITAAENIRAKNFHPTCKPVALMSYLITIGSRKGDVVLDPFTGSGTTGVAAILLERNSINMELSEEYARIAKARIDHARANLQRSLF